VSAGRTRELCQGRHTDRHRIDYMPELWRLTAGDGLRERGVCVCTVCDVSDCVCARVCDNYLLPCQAPDFGPLSKVSPLSVYSSGGLCLSISFLMLSEPHALYFLQSCNLVVNWVLVVFKCVF
jgi:hypothetical protein